MMSEKKSIADSAAAQTPDELELLVKSLLERNNKWAKKLQGVPGEL